MEKSVTRDIAEQVVELGFIDHPDDVRSKVRQAVVEAIGNALLARETPLGRSYLAQIHDTPNGSPVFGNDRRASPADAAFANAGLTNALDWDDTARAGGHPGSSIIPAALVAAYEENATIPDFLSGIVLGYEVSERVALALQPTWERYDLVHGSGTRHAIGAGAAVAAIRSSSVANAQETIGIAAQLAPVPHAGKFGWGESRLTWLKDNNARAATAAVRAGQFPDRFTAPRRSLDGERGFWRMAGSDQCDWEALATPLDDPYLIGTLELKPYPCCRWLHTAVEATIRASNELETVETAHVETTGRIATSFMIDPINQVNAQFSLPFAVAQAASGREFTDWFRFDGPAAVPEIVVTASANEELTARFESERVIGAEVTVSDGNEDATVAVDEPLGSGSRPISMDRSRDKLCTGCDRVFGRGTKRAERIESVLHTDETIGTFIEVVSER